MAKNMEKVNILNLKQLYQFVTDLENGLISEDEAEEVVERIDAFLQKKDNDAIHTNYEWQEDPKNSEIVTLWDDIFCLTKKDII